ncbi:MAG TPA: hypothetical protein VIH60_01030 [Steroidobacteraceae bacterium]
MKRLLLLGAVVTFVVSVNAEPPPSLPFESMDWPASMKREPTKGITLGTLQVTFETTTLTAVLKAASAGAIAHTGDAGGSIYWLCYSIPHGHAADRIWIISHGEMGGPEGRVTSFAASRIDDGKATADCPPLPAELEPASLETNVWLGAVDAEIQQHLGTPSHHAGVWKAYNFQTKVPGDCEGGYDLLNWLFIKSVKGQVATIYAGQVSSC